MKRGARCVVVTALFLSACQAGPSAQYAVLEMQTPNQKESLNKSTGEKIVQSRGKNSDVIISLTGDPAWQAYGSTVVIKIRNSSSRPVAFDEGSIVAEKGGKPVPVLGYLGMQAVVEQKKQEQEAVAAFGMALGAVAGGMAGSGRFNYATTAALQAGSSLAVAASTVSLAQAQANAFVENDEIPTSFVGDVVLAPKASYGGLVVVADPEPGSALNLNVSVGGDVHAVTLRR